MPKDDTVQPTVIVPPVLQDDVVAPNITIKTDVINPSPTDITSVGSAAPANDVVAPLNDVVMPTQEISSTPRKKFAGGKVIATILGLFLLVGGVGAGVYLTGQNQNINEKAGSCYDDCREGGGGNLVCDCECGGTNSRCPTGDGDGDPGNDITTGSNQSACVAGGGYWCNAVSDNNGPIPAFCALPGQNCGNTAVDLGYDLSGTVFDPTSYVKAGCESYVNLQSGCVTIDVPVASFNCPNQSESDSLSGCNQNGGTSKCLSSSACGTQQIDFLGDNGTACYLSKYRECGGNNQPEPTPNPTPTPTAPPAITASCQNLKAYSTTGNTEVPLTGQQLSALKPGNQFNLCVQGIKTGGSFNKVRFTINGALQPEQVVTDRVGTTTEGKFCTVYTIPQTLPAGGVFTFKAEMHHVTLGWK